MEWNKKKDSIYLACGHGTQINGVWDSGCAYGKYTEADLMLPIVEAAVKLLKKSGVKVYTDKDNKKNMTATVDEANKKKVTLYMSVHCDYKGAPAGVAPLYVSSEGKKFAAKVGKKVAKLMNMKYRGAFKRTDLYELNATDMPSVIFETGSIKADLKYLKEAKKYGRALAKGILEYIGVPVYVSNRTKMARKMNEFAYAKAPAKAKYPSGKPKKAYKKGLKHAYPDRSKWSKAPRDGASCDVCMGTVVRESGVDKKFPRALGKQDDYMEKSKKFKRIKKSELKTGDIIIYKNKGKNTGHICMYYGGKIKHASYKKWYPRTTNNAKSQTSKAKRSWVHFYRAKG